MTSEGGAYNHGTIFSFTLAPEPSMCALIGTTAACALIYGWRLRRNENLPRY
jgi:hypothetical protein